MEEKVSGMEESSSVQNTADYLTGDQKTWENFSIMEVVHLEEESCLFV